MLSDYADTLSTLAADSDHVFIVISTALVFFMQCGFVMLSVGSVRAKNAKNIVLKILLDATVGGLCWYITGYAFAFGGNLTSDGSGTQGNGFIGNNYFALHGLPEGMYQHWIFQYAFAATSATIVSGAVAERTKFEAYLLYSVLLTAFVYPVIAHWQWDENGWLSPYKPTDRFLDSGCLDFAGDGPVHMIGGLAGLAGALIVGPRIGRYDANGRVNDIPGHSVSFMLLGVFILWFGWYGFNPGSAGKLSDGLSKVVALAALNTTLAGAMGCIGSFFEQLVITYVKEKVIVWDLVIAGNGALAGLVGITGSCGFVRPWAAVLIGLIAGIIYPIASVIVSHVFKVDDPLDAIAVHAFCGCWGLIAVAAFADKAWLDLAYGPTFDGKERPYGFIMGGGGKLLGAQIVQIICLTAMVLGTMIPFFLLMKTLGILRVDREEELAGLDVSHHGGSAYPGDPFTAEVEGSKGAQMKMFKQMQEEIAVLKREVGSLRSSARKEGGNNA